MYNVPGKYVKLYLHSLSQQNDTITLSDTNSALTKESVTFDSLLNIDACYDKCWTRGKCTSNKEKE